MTAREGGQQGQQSRQDQTRFGSGTPGDPGTLSGVGAQPEGGGAGLGAQVASGDGSPRDIAEAGGNPQHRNAPGPDLEEATELASEAYEQTEDEDSYLRPGSGDRNTPEGRSTQGLNQQADGSRLD